MFCSKGNTYPGIFSGKNQIKVVLVFLANLPFNWAQTQELILYAYSILFKLLLWQADNYIYMLSHGYAQCRAKFSDANLNYAGPVFCTPTAPTSTLCRL